MRKSKGLTFFLSFVPGLGHYYLGQMMRGLQIMILFFGSLFLFSFLGFEMFFPFFVPVIWFYSLFDALQQNRKINEEQAIIDQPLIPWDKVKVKKHWFGWGMISLGVYLMLDKLSYYYSGWSWRLIETSRGVIIAIVFIGIGIYIISGKKIKSE